MNMLGPKFYLGLCFLADPIFNEKGLGDDNDDEVLSDRPISYSG